MVLDIGPTSLHVEWPPSFYPADDGGVLLQLVRLTPYLVKEKSFVDTNFTVDLEEGFVIIFGLEYDTVYQIKMEFGNAQGAKILGLFVTITSCSIQLIACCLEELMGMANACPSD